MTMTGIGLPVHKAPHGGADEQHEATRKVIFDVYTVHGSRSNLGRRSRAGYAVRFFPSTSTYDHTASDDEYKVAGGVAARELILVRGQDRAGNKHRRNDGAAHKG